MAHLWIRDKAQQWAVLPLDHDAFALETLPPKALHNESRDALCSVLLVRTRAEETSWVLIAGARGKARVNGIPLRTGIRVITDRDEIRIPESGSVYFSAESLAKVEEFAGADQPMFCPRCKQEVERGSPAVKCPGCGLWHHEFGELNCWTYAKVCASCAHSTDLNAGFQWTPEEL